MPTNGVRRVQRFTQSNALRGARALQLYNMVRDVQIQLVFFSQHFLLPCVENVLRFP